MKSHISFTKAENAVRHEFWQNLNNAESTEDISKFFVYAVQDLIEFAFNERVTVEFDDIRLMPEQEDGFVLSADFRQNRDIAEALESTDLHAVLVRFAATAIKHSRHLDKHRDKPESTIYPTVAHQGKEFHETQTKQKR